MCQRCPSAFPGAALAILSERGPSACQSRWTWDQAWLVSSWKCAQDTLEMLVAWEFRASQSGQDGLERHRSPPYARRILCLRPSQHVVQTGSCSLRRAYGGDHWPIWIAAQISPWYAATGPPPRSGPLDPVEGLEPC